MRPNTRAHSLRYQTGEKNADSVKVGRPPRVSVALPSRPICQPIRRLFAARDSSVPGSLPSLAADRAEGGFRWLDVGGATVPVPMSVPLCPCCRYPDSCLSAHPRAQTRAIERSTKPRPVPALGSDTLACSAVRDPHEGRRPLHAGPSAGLSARLVRSGSR
jgi:hypothetical protein